MIRLVIGVALLYLATVLAAHLGWFGLRLNPEIKPVELAIFFVNVSIAVYVGRYFATKDRNLRAEKDLLIPDLRDVLACLKESREILTDCHAVSRMTPEKRKGVLSIMRRLANGLENLQTELAVSQCKRLATDPDFDGLKDAYLS